MLNYDEYRNLCCLINENPDIISVFDNMSMFSIDELSIDSHDIKNHLAYLKTSFQLLKKKSPELSENKYIIRMEDVLSQLIYHMERTTLYRYSMKKADKKPIVSILANSKILNAYTIQSLLESQAEHFKRFPEQYIANYEKDKQKFFREKQ